MTGLYLMHFFILAVYVIAFGTIWVSSLCRSRTRRHRSCGLLPGEDRCGVVIVNERVVGGHDATLGQFPWIAILYYQQPGVSGAGRFQPFCGGSVINDRYVVSAAHCLIDPRDLRIWVGEHNLRSVVDCKEKGVCTPEAQDFEVENVIAHPKYNETTVAYDLALIRLGEKVTFNQYVHPICMPTDRIFRRERTFQRKVLDVAGWGISRYVGGEGVFPAILQTAALPYVPRRQCERAYGGRLSCSKICAGGEGGRNACKGDSGGPLMGQFAPHRTRNRSFLIGVVSFGMIPCGDTSHPSVYANVPELSRWVLDNIRP